mmetsp:Transcript_75106/g.208886  ORF Transcript_75106/g.208886 Transcript_75106/m.208886 type:complete len:92 (+) Transcript_75106:1573-1848(+)
MSQHLTMLLMLRPLCGRGEQHAAAATPTSTPRLFESELRGRIALVAGNADVLCSCARAALHALHGAVVNKAGGAEEYEPSRETGAKGFAHT